MSMLRHDHTQWRGGGGGTNIFQVFESDTQFFPPIKWGGGGCVNIQPPTAIADNSLIMK